MELGLLEKIEQLIRDELPFFMLRKKGQDQVRLLHQHDQKLYKTQHDKMACACFSKFESVNNQYFIYADSDQYFNFIKQEVSDHFDLSSFPIGSHAAQIYHEKLVGTAIRCLKNGDFKKVVLSRKQQINGDFKVKRIIENLLNEYPEANCYFWYHPKIGTWCGATPEVLLNYSGNILHTMSLAGTMKKENLDAIQWGDKEKEEQQIVTDSIVEDLKSVGIERLNLGKQHTIAAGDLLHLQTDIEVKTSNNNVGAYLQALHPTPAVCGLPKNFALNFIRENEGYDRSFYTGYLGIINEDVQEYFVNLRCMQLIPEGVILYAGGGITHKSNARDEYLETVNKMQTMSKLLN